MAHEYVQEMGVQQVVCSAPVVRVWVSGRVCARGALAARLVSIAGRAVAAGGRAEGRGRGDVQEQHLHGCVPVGFLIFFFLNGIIYS